MGKLLNINSLPLQQDIEPLFNRATTIIEECHSYAYRQVNEALVRRNWAIGKLISENLEKEIRTNYGKKIIVNLSKKLTDQYGKGFSRRDLYTYLSFYNNYQRLFTISEDAKIVYSLSTQSIQILSWTHYRTLIQELNSEARHMTYMPSQEQLRAEIERQKEIFYLKATEQKNQDL